MEDDLYYVKEVDGGWVITDGIMDDEDCPFFTSLDTANSYSDYCNRRYHQNSVEGASI